MKSKREDGRGHPKAISETEQSKTFGIKVTESMFELLRKIPRDDIREMFNNLINKIKRSR